MKQEDQAILEKLSSLYEAKIAEEKSAIASTLFEARIDKEFGERVIFQTIDYWIEQLPKQQQSKLHLQGLTADDFVEGMTKTGQEGKSDAQTYGAVIKKYVKKIEQTPFYLKVHTKDGGVFVKDRNKRGPLPKLTLKVEATDRLENAKQRFLKSESVVLKENEIELFFCEDSQEHYYIEFNEETLEEQRIHIRITSKGERIKKIRCPEGRVVKMVNGRRMCVTPSGSQKLAKKLAIKRSVRTKKAKGGGAKKRANFKRQKAMRKRRQMGLSK